MCVRARARACVKKFKVSIIWKQKNICVLFFVSDDVSTVHLLATTDARRLDGRTHRCVERAVQTDHVLHEKRDA